MLPSTIGSKPVALVTGGASYLGTAISRKLAAKGFLVALHYQASREKTKNLAREISTSPKDTLVVQSDFHKPERVEILIRKVIREFKRLDLLVNNASFFSPTPLATASPTEWRKMMEVNLLSPYFLSRAAAPWLRKARGSIVNLTDIYAEHPLLKGYSAYCASKAALLCATKSLAGELGPEVRVNAVSPGAIFIPKSYSAKQREELIARSALKRQGTPEDIAEAVYFLATQGFVTGQVLNVDGGRFL